MILAKVILLEQKKQIITLPNGLINCIAKIGRTLRIPLPFNTAMIPYATRYWYVDNTKAKSELGVRFRPIEEVLGPTLNWLIQEKKLGSYAL